MRWKRVVVICGAIALAAAVGAVSWGLVAYNEVTRVDRSEPQVVADHFLRAVLIAKDEAGAELYACRDGSKDDRVWALRNELDTREKDFGVTVIVNWGAYEVNDADLTTQITITANRDGQELSSSTQRWRLHLIDEDGWRVCGAERVDVSTSPS